MRLVLRRLQDPPADAQSAHTVIHPHALERAQAGRECLDRTAGDGSPVYRSHEKGAGRRHQITVIGREARGGVESLLEPSVELREIWATHQRADGSRDRRVRWSGRPAAAGGGLPSSPRAAVHVESGKISRGGASVVLSERLLSSRTSCRPAAVHLACRTRSSSGTRLSRMRPFRSSAPTRRRP